MNSGECRGVAGECVCFGSGGRGQIVSWGGQRRMFGECCGVAGERARSAAEWWARVGV